MASRLLLTHDVDSLGRSGDLVAVRAGYARNFLLPQGFAVVADKQALRKQKLLQEKRQQKAVADKNEAEKLAAQFAAIDATVEVTVKVDHEGHMYGSVSAADIVHLIADQLKLTVEKRNVGIKHAIKETGVHKIDLKLDEGILATVTVKITPEDVFGTQK